MLIYCSPLLIALRIISRRTKSGPNLERLISKVVFPTIINVHAPLYLKISLEVVLPPVTRVLLPISATAPRIKPGLPMDVVGFVTNLLNQDFKLTGVLITKLLVVKSFGK